MASLPALADMFDLSDDQRQGYWREICKALEPAFAAPSGPDKAKTVIQSIRIAREELAKLVLNEKDVVPQSATNPVGRCPKCKTFWYHYQRFCIGCGFQRIDW